MRRMNLFFVWAKNLKKVFIGQPTVISTLAKIEIKLLWKFEGKLQLNLFILKDQFKSNKNQDHEDEKFSY